MSTLVKMPHCWKSHATAQMIHGYIEKSASGFPFLCDLVELIQFSVLYKRIEFPFLKKKII